MTDRAFDEELPFSTPADVRRQVADRLIGRMETIVGDGVALFPFSGPQPLEAEYCRQLGVALLQLMAASVREGRIDPSTGLIVDLHRLALARQLAVDRLFTFAYLIERAALDELALDDTVGATTEPWAAVAQLVRRASFDALAGYTERALLEPSSAAIVDRLTTLHTRDVIVAALEKELSRIERASAQLAFIIFDVDRLAAINRDYGFGVGDRVVERLGILVRTYFRLYDWVARHGEDAISVLLVSTGAEDALTLAERVRGTVEERLAFRDHRVEGRVKVTVSAAVVTVEGVRGEPMAVDRVLVEADRALARAKQAGRNRVEHSIITPLSMTLAEAAEFLGVSTATVRKLVASGALKTVGAARNKRIPRMAIEQFKMKKRR
jgi:diguanylate cyclase (GGDEF)-like protein/excisionase family DNA binding protein